MIVPYAYIAGYPEIIGAWFNIDTCALGGIVALYTPAGHIKGALILYIHAAPGGTCIVVYLTSGHGEGAVAPYIDTSALGSIRSVFVYLAAVHIEGCAIDTYGSALLGGVVAVDTASGHIEHGI